jgi:hypothetical protein
MLALGPSVSRLFQDAAELFIGGFARLVLSGSDWSREKLTPLPSVCTSSESPGSRLLGTTHEGAFSWREVGLSEK